MVLDSLNTAKNINIASGLEINNGLASSFDKHDYYGFDLSGATNLYLSLKGLSSDIDLSILDGNGNTIASSTRGGSSAEDISRTLGTGRYYVDVYQYSGSSSYQLVTTTNQLFANVNDEVSLLLGDFNGDSYRDVVRQEKGSLVNGSNDVQVIMGQGNGGFQSPFQITDAGITNGNIVKLFAGDFNGDGRSDLIRQEFGQYINGVNDAQFMEFQNGNFRVTRNMPDMGAMNGDLTNLIAGDFNGDGRADLIRQEKGGWINGDRDVEVYIFDASWGIQQRLTMNESNINTDNDAELVAGNFIAGGGVDLMRIEKPRNINGVNDILFYNFQGGNFQRAEPNFNDLPSTIIPTGRFKAEYFNNNSLSGTATVVREENSINYDWGANSPVGGVSSDNFSVRWTGNFNFAESGKYTFLSSIDDGMRIWIDNNLVHDTWNGRNALNNVNKPDVNAGMHTVKVEYREDGGLATAKVNWFKEINESRNNSSEWQATVFTWDGGSAPSTRFYEDSSKSLANVNLGGNNRSDGRKGLNVDWGTGAVKGYTGLPVDNYAIRAYTTEHFNGTYQFNIRADDGYQLFAKNIRTGVYTDITANTATSWQSAYGAYATYNINLVDGDYDLHFQMFERGGNAYIDLSWQQIPTLPVSSFNSTFGYGLVNAAEAVARSVNQPTFADVANLGGNNWGDDLVNSPEVWARGYQGQGVIVAVVDSGVDYNHADLNSNIWTNTREIAGNSIDDDNNGYIDDVHGWDFVQRDNDAMDVNGHGTHVAGTIAARNDGVGLTGVAYGAKIMPVRVLGNEGGGNYTDVALGVRYAVDNGARVINLSLGGGGSTEMDAAIAYASQRGAIVVMAAGNEAVSSPGYPAQQAINYGVAVGGVNRYRQMPGFSNRAGNNSAMQYVVAPAVDVYSLSIGGSYRTLNGTSMATPHVAGVVALMLSANPNLTDAQVRYIITSTANQAGLSALSTSISSNNVVSPSGIPRISSLNLPSIDFSIRERFPHDDKSKFYVKYLANNNNLNIDLLNCNHRGSFMLEVSPEVNISRDENNYYVSDADELFGLDLNLTKSKPFLALQNS
jgi:subtilisin family serine protease